MSTQPQSSTLKSRWIWPFEIIEQIGEGGMGVVFRARYVVNGREVALKMLPGDVSDQTALARFEREVEVLKTLRHPNIVRCFGGVCEDKRRFYAMELLQGGSLEDQLAAKKKFPWEQVVQFALQMCAALDCSHEKGVVHRDVKPSNFLIGPKGQLKLSDFGLASVTSSRKITAAGKTAGTFLYMAPEQIRGQEVSPRTDLYALGCVLFELVTGHVPFLGETAAATLHLHCHTPPPRPTEKALDCPVSLERIILKLLEKAPEDRYQTAAEVAKALRAVSQTVTITNRKERSHNFPTGYDEETKAAVAVPDALKPKTEPLPTSKSPTRLAGILSVALLISLYLNAYQFRQLATFKQPLQLWTEAYQSNDPEVRTAAAKALGKMGTRNRQSLDLLIQGLDGTEAPQQIAAITGLAESGHAGTPALTKLIKIQQTSPDPQLRDAAALSIRAIRTAPAPHKFHWLLDFIGLALLAATAYGVYQWVQKAATN